MAKTKKKSNSRPGACATLLLDPVFYPRRLIQQAARDFASMADIDVVKKGDRLELKFSGMNRAVARYLPDEFANYLLALYLESK